jgi:PKD repeat protein
MAERIVNARWLCGGALFIGLSAAALVALASPALAATQVPAGSMTADETWTLSNSPYDLGGDVTVPRGVTLTLDAGTIVSAPAGVRLIIEGDLHGFGNPGSLITFGPSAGSWGGLVVNAFGNATVLNATVLAADRGLLVSTMGTVYLADVTFNGTLGDAILVPQQPRLVYLQKVTIDGASRGLVAANAMVNITAVRFSVKSTSFCVVASQASNLALLNFSLAGCTDAAINMSLSSDITIFDGNISEWNGAAISAISCTRLNITSNQFYSSIPGSGVHVVGTSNSVVARNTLSTLSLPGGALLPFTPIGIDVEAPTGTNRVEQNSVTTFAMGIRVKDAIFTQRIEANSVGKGSDTGIEILDSINQSLLGNSINGREYPFAVNVTASTTPNFYRHFLDANNTANGSRIIYLLDQADTAFDLWATPGAIFALVNARNVTVVNANLSHGIPSLLVANSVDVAVQDAVIQSNITGIEVYNGTRTRLSNITLDGGMSCVRFRAGADNRATLLTTTRCLHGVLTEGLETRLVLDNITLSNGTRRVAFFEGIDLTLRDALILSPETTAFSNAMTLVGRGGQTIDLLGKPRGISLINVTIEGARDAIVLEGFSNITLTGVRVAQSITAVTLRHMSQVTLRGSSFAGEFYGVLASNLTDSRFNGSTFAGAKLEGVFCVTCSNVTVEANIFAGNGVGLAFASGGRSLIVRNFFFANTLHATADSGVNDFDDGAIGNLWDDYTGIDADDNGIGDTPYTIATGIDEDRYPIARYPDDIGPVADAGPDMVVFEDAPLLLTGYLSTDDVGIRVYLWSFVDHGANVTVTGESTRYVFRTPGTYVVTLTVIDWGGNRDSDTLVVTVLDRTPPHADGGGDRTVDEDVAVTLDGSASFDNDPAFPSGAAFTWWVFDSNGTFAVFGRTASWTFATPGNFTVQLVVDDAAGFSDDTEFKVTVRDKTPPTVGPLTPPSAVEDFPFRVYASNVSDNDPNWPVGMTAWFELRRAGELIVSTNASPGVFNVTDPGPYTVSYYVRDASGNTGVSTMNFEVGDVTAPDLSLFLERSAEVGDPFVMDLSLATDNNPTFPGGANATWTVQLAVGSLTLTGASVQHTFTAIGDWTVELHLRDAGGNLAEKTFVVHVRDTRPPQATIAGPTTVEAGEEATFRAIASDPSGISSYVWYLTGLATPRSGQSLVYRFYTPGSYQITVKVEDLLGHITNVSATLYVVDTTAPQVVISTTPTMHGGAVSVALLAVVQASFLGTDPSGIASVEWAWGDGNVTTGTAVSHTYAVAGNYTVLVRVADQAGNANTTTFRVEVIGPPGPPPGSGNNTQQPVPVSGGLPLPALIALIAAGTVGGVLVGLRIGRGPRRLEEPKP